MKHFLCQFVWFKLILWSWTRTKNERNSSSAMRVASSTKFLTCKPKYIVIANKFFMLQKTIEMHWAALASAIGRDPKARGISAMLLSLNATVDICAVSIRPISDHLCTIYYCYYYYMNVDRPLKQYHRPTRHLPFASSTAARSLLSKFRLWILCVVAGRPSRNRLATSIIINAAALDGSAKWRTMCGSAKQCHGATK